MNDDSSNKDRPLVLVADDEEDIVTLVALRLQKQGYEVVTAADGQQAIDLAFERLPALAVLDVRMPHLDGYEVTERLRANNATAQMPIVLLSASVHQANVDRGFEVGATAYLRKPFVPSELLDQVDVLLRGNS